MNALETLTRQENITRTVTVICLQEDDWKRNKSDVKLLISKIKQCKIGERIEIIINTDQVENILGIMISPKNGRIIVPKIR